MSEFEEVSVKVEKRLGNEISTFQPWKSHEPINSWHFHQSSHTYWCQNNTTTDIEVLPEEKQDKTGQNKAITKNERKETNRSSWVLSTWYMYVYLPVTYMHKITLTFGCFHFSPESVGYLLLIWVNFTGSNKIWKVILSFPSSIVFSLSSVIWTSS